MEVALAESSASKAHTAGAARAPIASTIKRLARDRARVTVKKVVAIPMRTWQANAATVKRPTASLHASV